MALFSHKSQLVYSFPLLHFAICLKWSCDLCQIIASFASNCAVIWRSLQRAFFYLVSCFNSFFKNVNAI